MSWLRFNSTFLMCFLVGNTVFPFPIIFGDKNSAIRILSGASFKIDTNMHVSDGRIVIDSGGSISSNLTDGQIVFDYGVLEKAGRSILIDHSYSLGLTSTTFLIGNKELLAEQGATFDVVQVSGSGNKIHGHPTFSDHQFKEDSELAGGRIILEDSDTVLELTVSNELTTSVNMNGGRIDLGADLKLADGITLNGGGTIVFNGHQLAFGGSDLTLDSYLMLDGASDIILNSKTSLSSTWTFSSDASLNGNGNVLDLGDTGKIWVQGGTTLHLTDIKIKGIRSPCTDSLDHNSFVLEDSSSRIELSYVTFELDTNITITEGVFYVEGPTTLITRDKTVTFDNDSLLEVDGQTLYYDTLDQTFGGIFPIDDSDDNLTLSNNGQIQQSGLTNLLITTSNAVVAHSNAINAHYDLLVNNSWAIVAGDIALAIENSWAIANLDQRVVENTNAIYANSWAISNLDQRVIENSNAVYANSWAISNLDQRVIENSNAIYANSWTISNLDQRVIENSNAIYANSWTISNLDQRVIENSNAIYANSWAISNLDQRVVENSSAILANSRALNAHYDLLVNNSFAILANSRAIALHYDLLVNNSFAILASSRAIDSHYDLLVNNSNAILANSGAIFRYDKEIFSGDISGLGPVLEDINISFNNIIKSLDWSPDGQYLAVGTGVDSGITTRVYRFDSETTLSELAGCQKTNDGDIYAVAWHPSGEFLAVAGVGGVGYNLRIYSFDGTTLTELSGCNTNTGTSDVNVLAWTSDGWNLAVGDGTPSTSSKVEIFWFDRWSSSLTSVTSFSQGGGVYGLDWDVTDRYLAMGAGDAANNNLRVFDFTVSTSTLTVETGSNKDFDTTVKSVKWDSTGGILFCGKSYDGPDYRIEGYSFDGSTLTELPGTQITIVVGAVNALEISSDDKTIFAGGYGNSEISAYTFEDSILTEVLGARVDTGAVSVKSIVLTPNGKFLASIWGNNGAEIEVLPVLFDSLISANSNSTYANSWAIVGGDIGLAISNSWAVLTLAELGSANSNAIVAHSGHLMNLDERLVATTDAVYANSWAIAAHGDRLDSAETLLESTSNTVNADHDLLIYNSNAIDSHYDLLVAISSAVYVNSWAINSGISELAVENSNAIVSHSGHLMNLDERLVATTDAVYANSWAIAAHGDRLDSAETLLESTSNTVNADHDLLIYNSNAIDSHYDLLVAISSAVYVNSWAINSGISELAVENSNAIVSHSGHLMNLDERLVATTDVVYANSWAIANLFGAINSSAIDIGDTTAGLTIDHSNGALYSAVWKPQSDVLVVGGAADLSSEEVAAYTFDSFAQTATKLPSSGIAHGATIYSVDWHPDGTYLAIGGAVGTPDAYEVKVYSFDGSAFTLLTNGKAVHGAWVYSVAWSPDGNCLAVGGDDGTGNYDIRVYDFTPGTQTIAVKTGCNKDHGGIVREVRWHPTGNYLAVGGTSGTGSYTARVYSFDGTNLTELSGCNKDHGATVYGIDWTGGGNTFAVVGGLGTSSVYGRLYEFNGSTTLTEKSATMPSHGDILYACRFNDNGTRLLVGGESGTDGYDMRLYLIEESRILEYTDARTEFGNAVYTNEWHFGGHWVLANGRTPDEAQIYPIIYGSLIEANSAAIVRLENIRVEDNLLLLATSDAVVAHSGHLINLEERMVVAEARLDTHDIAISDLDGRLIAATDAISAFSSHLINLDERLVAATDSIYANSWAISDLDIRVTENSNAVHVNSWAISDLDIRVFENSNAINANSWAISDLDIRVLENSNAVNANSWTIASIDICASTYSDAVYASSWAIANLDQRVIENSNAVYANSWAISDLDRRIIENSNAIHANSWAIFAGDIGLALATSDAVNAHYYNLIIPNSNAIIHNSWSLSTIDHGPGNIWLVDGLTTLSYDVVLTASHRMYAMGYGVENDNICAGEGRKISLRYDGINPLIYVDAGVTLMFENLILEDFADGAISLADDDSSLIFGDGTCVSLGKSQSLSRTWTFSGESVFVGHDHILDLADGGIVVNSWSSLLMQNMHIEGVSETNVLCLDQHATVSFNDSSWLLSNNYTFKRGSFDVLTEFDLDGTASWIFYYSSTSTSTVHSNALFKIGRNGTFSYSPDSIGQDMFQFADSTAILYLDNATLHSTTTGVRFSKGTIIIEGDCALSSDAQVLSEAICLGDGVDENNDIIVDISPGSSLVLDGGIVRDDNMFGVTS